MKPSKRREIEARLRVLIQNAQREPHDPARGGRPNLPSVQIIWKRRNRSAGAPSPESSASPAAIRRTGT